MNTLDTYIIYLDDAIYAQSQVKELLAVWEQALSLNDVETLLSVGLSAYLRDRLDIAESAFRAAASR